MSAAAVAAPLTSQSGAVSLGARRLDDLFTRVMPVVGRNAKLLPILCGVRLTAGAGKLVCTGTDLDVWLSASIEVDVAEPFDIAINPRHLRKALRWCGGNVALRVEGDGDTTDLYVTAGRTKMKLRCADRSAWPAGPQLAGDTVTFDAVAIDRIRRVAGFCSTDDHRPVLTGVEVSAEHVVGTDSYRLGIADIHVPGCPTVLVPARALRWLPATMLPDETMDVTIDERAAGQARWTSDGLEVTTRLIEGQFPNWRTLLPESTTPVRFQVDRAGLVAALRRCSAVLEDAQPVRVRLFDGTVQLAAVNDLIGEIEEALDADVVGARDGDQVAFNPAYFLQCLAAADDEQVTVELIDALKPATMRNDGLTALLMPVRVS